MTEQSVQTTIEEPWRTSELQVGDTIFTVVSLQSDAARDTAYTKVKKLILNNVNKVGTIAENR